MENNMENEKKEEIKNDIIGINIEYDLLCDLSDHHISSDKNEVRYLILTNIGEVKKLSIQNWYFNRPVDLTRIPEIVKSYRGKKMIDGIIYIYKIDNKDNNIKYYCYDGIHRLTSIEELDDNMYILLDIYDNPNEGIIINQFKRLNQTNPVPELYLNQTNKTNKTTNIKEILEKVVEKYYNKYSKTSNNQSFFSSRRNPNIPNENKSNMTDKLYSLLKDNEHESIFNKFNYDKWIDFLERKNKYFKNNIHIFKVSSKQKSKCIKDEMYLFICKDWELKYNSIILSSM
jgi:hypothetical protein